MHAAAPISIVLPWPAAALLTHLWQSTVVGLIILLLLAAARGLTAASRLVLAWIGLLKFIVPAAVFSPMIAWVHAYAPAWPTPPVVAAAFSLRAFGGDASGSRPAFPVPFLGAIALIIWGAVGAGLFAFWLIRGARLRRRILAKAVPAPESVERQLMSAADRIGLWPIPQCREVDDDEGVGVMGALSSYVVVPRSLESMLTAQEFKAILLHECIHEQRSDNLWSAIQTALLCLFWFNPVVWLLSRRISLETEQSCDEAVVRITADPETYSRAIVKSVRQCLGLAQPGFAGAATNPVLARLRNIGEFGSHRDRQWIRRGVLGLASGVVLFSSYAGSLAAAVIAEPIRPLAQERTGTAAGLPAVAVIPFVAGVVAQDSYDVAEVDQAPRLTREVRPSYPFTMRLNRINGAVLVSFTVDTDGRVENPKAELSSEREFEPAALTAVSLWRFTPGYRQGVPVRTRVKLPVVFSLDGETDAGSGFAAP